MLIYETHLESSCLSQKSGPAVDLNGAQAAMPQFSHSCLNHKTQKIPFSIVAQNCGSTITRFRCLTSRSRRSSQIISVGGGCAHGVCACVRTCAPVSMLMRVRVYVWMLALVHHVYGHEPAHVRMGSCLGVCSRRCACARRYRCSCGTYTGAGMRPGACLCLGACGPGCAGAVVCVRLGSVRGWEPAGLGAFGV